MTIMLTNSKAIHINQTHKVDIYQYLSRIFCAGIIVARSLLYTNYPLNWG